MERLYKTENMTLNNIALYIAGAVCVTALNFGWASPANPRAGYFWNLFSVLKLNPILIHN